MFMSGEHQAVGHAHFVHRVLDCGLDPQQAVEAPRAFAFNKLRVERTIAAPVIEDLQRRGHNVGVVMATMSCQAIWIDHERAELIGEL